MADYHDILQKVWGFRQFRPLQEDIVKSVLAGRDTLALMPTGGGKSITFQVPALTMEGICIVITPLIALMKDQVERLNKLEIKAQAIFSGMTYDEINVALNNCIYGNYKFLYIAPERIGSELFIARFQNMPVNLIAVDEAHCISQWGYDFRPSYLKISNLRKYFPQVPVLALTATATSPVVEDIQEKLQFGAKNLLKQSFERKNLTYAVRHSENKQKDLLDIIKKINGSGIVYARNRRKCKELAVFLKQNKISADYYHAGLKHEVRAQRQESWTEGRTNVIVATNAFGMGIDKADVRLVVHIDIPDTIEAYFQEAGRAGRDGNQAYAILLFASSDKNIASQRIAANFPDLDTIKNVYQAACNHCRVAIGGGKGMSFDFNLADFTTQFRFNPFQAFSSLKILEREGYIEVTDEMNNPSRIKFLLSRDDLYRFQVANAKFDAFIKLVLRSYTGIFTDYTGIDELMLAKRAGVDVDVVFQYLSRLNALKVIRYIPQRKTPLLIFNEERLDDKSLYISKENYRDRKERFAANLEAMLNYTQSADKCRSVMLLEYFGEKNAEACGQCDVCKRKKEKELGSQEFEMMKEEIEAIVKMEPISLNNLVDKIPFNKKKLIQTIQWMLDNGNLQYNNDYNLVWGKG
ncbi:MAG: RecQ family ATP-dependent DNA helicase [Bacteroidales bacterium]